MGRTGHSAFHMLFLDGAYVQRSEGSVRLRWLKPPTSAELTRLAQTLAQRIGRLLERLAPRLVIGHRRRRSPMCSGAPVVACTAAAVAWARA